MMRRAACVGLLGVVVLAGCGGSSSGSSLPAGVVAVVDGNDITVSQLETTMKIAKLSMKTSYPVVGTAAFVRRGSGANARITPTSC